MANSPLFSIVTVCYNAVQTIEATILSVINQTYPNFEYIIIDGGSTDGTLEIIKKYSAHIKKVVSEPDNGIYDAMNKGIKMVSGEYINFMNSGDCFASAAVLEDLTKIIPRNKTVDIIYGNTYKHNNNKRWKDYSHKPDVLRHHGAFCHQSAFVRKDYHRSNLFDLNYKIMGDFNFFHKAYMKGASFMKVDIFIAEYDAEIGASLSHIQQNYHEINLILRDTDTIPRYICRNIRHLLGRIRRFLK